MLNLFSPFTRGEDGRRPEEGDQASIAPHPSSPSLWNTGATGAIGYVGTLDIRVSYPELKF